MNKIEHYGDLVMHYMNRFSKRNLAEMLARLALGKGDEEE
tara:strand:+ start:226 stop:345 length:120 start_codon:yes stop_codon:yes gene_type:complete